MSFLAIFTFGNINELFKTSIYAQLAEDVVKSFVGFDIFFLSLIIPPALFCGFILFLKVLGRDVKTPPLCTGLITIILAIFFFGNTTFLTISWLDINLPTYRGIPVTVQHTTPEQKIVHFKIPFIFEVNVARREKTTLENIGISDAALEEYANQITASIGLWGGIVVCLFILWILSMPSQKERDEERTNMLISGLLEAVKNKDNKDK